MGYIDVILPFAGGLLFFLYPDIVVSRKSENPEHKKRKLKVAGIALLVAAAILLAVRLMSR